MRTGMTAFTMLIVAGTCNVVTQALAQPKNSAPTFEVVSIKRHAVDQPAGRAVGSIIQERPDGGFTITNVSVATLIARAYPPVVPVDIVGLPGWANSETYDVTATSSLSVATLDDRLAMLRAMLADRFSLALHFEKRAQPAYDLSLAHSDGRLGPRMKRMDVDCPAQMAAEQASIRGLFTAATAPQSGKPPDFKTPPPRCTLRMVGNRLEGETTMANLAAMLRIPVGRVVVDKTGLSGTFRVTMDFPRMAFGLRGPDVTASADGPSVFTAIREQLGLKLEPSQAEGEMLVIDRLERPTEN